MKTKFLTIFFALSLLFALSYDDPVRDSEADQTEINVQTLDQADAALVFNQEVTNPLTHNAEIGTATEGTPEGAKLISFTAFEGKNYSPDVLVNNYKATNDKSKPIYYLALQPRPVLKFLIKFT